MVIIMIMNGEHCIKEDRLVGQWWCQWDGEIYFLILANWVTRISWFILLSWVQQTWVWITIICSLRHSWSILAAANESFSDFEQQDHFYTIIHFPLHHCLMLTDCQSLAGKLRAGQWTVRWQQLMVVPSNSIRVNLSTPATWNLPRPMNSRTPQLENNLYDER